MGSLQSLLTDFRHSRCSTPFHSSVAKRLISHKIWTCPRSSIMQACHLDVLTFVWPDFIVKYSCLHACQAARVRSKYSNEKHELCFLCLMHHDYAINFAATGKNQCCSSLYWEDKRFNNTYFSCPFDFQSFYDFQSMICSRTTPCTPAFLSVTDR